MIKNNITLFFVEHFPNIKYMFSESYHMTLLNIQMHISAYINSKRLTRFAPAWAQNIERIPVPQPTSTTTCKHYGIKKVGRELYKLCFFKVILHTMQNTTQTHNIMTAYIYWDYKTWKKNYQIKQLIYMYWSMCVSPHTYR